MSKIIEIPRDSSQMKTIEKLFGEGAECALPNILKEGVMLFDRPNEQEVFLFSSIVALSSILPGVSAIYFSDEVFANLYGFVVGEPASGKAAMKYAAKLIYPVHDYIVNQGGQILTTTQADTGKEKDNTWAKGLIVQGDISQAALMTSFYQNPSGIAMIETEADTTSQAIGKEYGGHSSTFRIVAHHEPIGKQRQTEKLNISIEKPRLTVLFSGTPDQVKGLIPSVKDGLFSRFAFLKLNDTGFIRGTQKKKSVDNQLEPIQQKILEIYKRSSESQYLFRMTDNQFDQLNDFIEVRFEECKQYGESARSISLRHGLIFYRIAMVLSALHHFERGYFNKPTIVCSDSVFKASLHLAEHLYQQSLDIYDDMGTGTFVPESGLQRKFLDTLPDPFLSPKDIKEVANKLGLAERTGRKYLKEFKDQGLVQEVAKLKFEKVK